MATALALAAFTAARENIHKLARPPRAGRALPDVGRPARPRPYQIEGPAARAQRPSRPVRTPTRSLVPRAALLTPRRSGALPTDRQGAERVLSPEWTQHRALLLYGWIASRPTDVDQIPVIFQPLLPRHLLETTPYGYGRHGHACSLPTGRAACAFRCWPANTPCSPASCAATPPADPAKRWRRARAPATTWPPSTASPAMRPSSHRRGPSGQTGTRARHTAPIGVTAADTPRGLRTPEQLATPILLLPSPRPHDDRLPARSGPALTRLPEKTCSGALALVAPTILASPRSGWSTRRRSRPPAWPRPRRARAARAAALAAEEAELAARRGRTRRTRRPDAAPPPSTPAPAPPSLH